MKRSYLETITGATIILITIIFSLFVINITNTKMNRNTYSLSAIFDNVEGIGIGSKVKIGGLDIGSVSKQEITNDYRIKLILKIDSSIKIPNDSSISISTSGLIGSKYLKVEIGGSDDNIKNGEEFEFTVSAMDLEDMIKRFMLNKAEDK